MKSIFALTAVLISCSALAADSRTYVAGRFALELDGKPAGLIHSVEGGGGSVSLAEMPVGSSIVKRFATPKYDDIAFEVGLDGSSPQLIDWLARFCNGQSPQKRGAILSTDYDLKVRQRNDFYDALITEVSFPALDASSKDAGYLALKITPYISSLKKGAGEVVKGNTATKQKPWISSNFRLAIDDLECKRVSKIDSFTIKQGLIESVGESRDYSKQPGKIEYPNLILRIPQADMDSWLKWYESFIVQANSSDTKNGTLTFLAPNLQTEIGHFNLKNVGLKRFTPYLPGSGDSAASFEVELYVESMTLAFGK